MAKNVKKYILTAIILGSIAAVSGGAVALVNLITEKKIMENDKIKLVSGIKDIFGDNATIDPENEQKVNDYTYTVSYYKVSGENNEFLGYAFKSEGSNMYGKIALISGFDAISHNFMSLSLINNEQTYATTLVDNYITPLNSDPEKLDDVSCGATYGAKLVRDMILEANEVAKTLWK